MEPLLGKCLRATHLGQIYSQWIPPFHTSGNRRKAVRYSKKLSGCSGTTHEDAAIRGLFSCLQQHSYRIGVGAGIVALLAMCPIVAWKKRLGPFRRRSATEGDTSGKTELHGDHKALVEAMARERLELEAAKHSYEAIGRDGAELETVESACEPKGSSKAIAEVYGSDLIHELPGHDNSVEAQAGATRTS